MLGRACRFAAISAPAASAIRRQRDAKLPRGLAIAHVGIEPRRLDQISISLIEPQQGFVGPVPATIDRRGVVKCRWNFFQE